LITDAFNKAADRDNELPLLISKQRQHITSSSFDASCSNNVTGNDNKPHLQFDQVYSK
jgi:hypothetical protein